MLLATVAPTLAQRGVGRHGDQNTVKHTQEHPSSFYSVTQTIYTTVSAKRGLEARAKCSLFDRFSTHNRGHG